MLFICLKAILCKWNALRADAFSKAVALLQQRLPAAYAQPNSATCLHYRVKSAHDPLKI
jgi:hypothetical protein